MTKAAMLWPAIAMTACVALGAAQAPSTAVRDFDLQGSSMTVHVGKEGVFSFAADTHEVTVPIASGSFDPVRQSVELTIDADNMQVQDPSSRHDQVQANMQGPHVLDVQRYPTIAFRSTQIQVNDASHWTVVGDLTLHGQTEPVTVHANRIDDNHFSGSVDVTQSAFGITPITIAGGTVRVKDTVNVSFTIALR